VNKMLLNTLYVLKERGYVRLDNETVRVEVDGETAGRVPMHHLGGLVLGADTMISPALLGECSERGISVTWMDRRGRFRASMRGKTKGNVLLRLAQFRAYEDTTRRLSIARDIVRAKLTNSRNMLLRRARDLNGARRETVREARAQIDRVIPRLEEAEGVDALMGLEGACASTYFGTFDAIVEGTGLPFERRSRRPPRNSFNALLSFLYTLLVRDCEAACEGVGLDPQVGFLHEVRPGRPSCALDLAEEFRSPLADRLAFALINRRQVTNARSFETRSGGAVLLTEEGRRGVVRAYQELKQREVTHALFSEKMPLGLVPHVQARLLARCLRGELDHYPGFESR